MKEKTKRFLLGGESELVACAILVSCFTVAMNVNFESPPVSKVIFLMLSVFTFVAFCSLVAGLILGNRRPRRIALLGILGVYAAACILGTYSLFFQ